MLATTVIASPVAAANGDWKNKTITFTVTDAASVVQTFTATTNALGVASTTQALGPNLDDVGVSFAGDPYYLTCASAGTTMVTVESAKAKITGGGWISQQDREHQLRVQRDPRRPRPPRPAPGPDGYSFTVSVVDNGTSGKKGDTISIVIKSPTNATVFTTSGPQPLKGGNIVVH